MPAACLLVIIVVTMHALKLKLKFCMFWYKPRPVIPPPPPPVLNFKLQCTVPNCLWYIKPRISDRFQIQTVSLMYLLLGSTIKDRTIWCFRTENNAKLLSNVLHRYTTLLIYRLQIFKMNLNCSSEVQIHTPDLYWLHKHCVTQTDTCKGEAKAKPRARSSLQGR